VPIYYFRFEDLISDPKKVLSEIFCIALGVESLEGTVMEQRIEEVVKKGSSGNALYKPRPGGG